MRVPFRKMHGCGNDFVVLDARAAQLCLTPARAAALADRRRGIGCDQLVTLEPPAAEAPQEGGAFKAGAFKADVFMRIRNPDGNEVEACGNVTRCVAQLLAQETGRRHVVVRTVAGDLAAEIGDDGQVEVDMGEARLDWRDIPLAHPADTLHLDLARGSVADPAAASMGNPHATFFVPNLDAVAPAVLGPILEHDPIFPRRANIGFAQILAPDRIRLRVWEREAGLTLACGSGACAALVNAHRRGLTGRRATLLLDGGDLLIAWRADGHVLMTGPAATTFTGSVDLDAYPQ